MKKILNFLLRWILIFSFSLIGIWADVYAWVIFSEDFDAQSDWTSGLAENDKGGLPNWAGPDRIQMTGTHNIPANWYAVRQDPVWAPSMWYPTKHEAIEILSSNVSKAKWGIWKSYVSWRDSYLLNSYWASDSILTKYFPWGYDELYVEFWIRFGDNWTRTTVPDTDNALTKLFRISSWSEDWDLYWFWGWRDNGPIVLWDHSITSYGLRNSIAMRAWPHGDNYGMNNDDVPDRPRDFVSWGAWDLTLWYVWETWWTNILLDKINWWFLDSDRYSSESHDQIFGLGDSWTKMWFYVKMNSAADIQDGIFRQWVDDTLVTEMITIPWIKSSSTEDTNAKWNTVHFWWNDFFRQYPNEDQHEEWYSIDDIIIYDSLPAYLDTSVSDTTAPSNLRTSIRNNECKSDSRYRWECIL